MTPTVKGQNKWDTPSNSRQHADRRHEVVITLKMDNVAFGLQDFSIKVRGEIIVSPPRPCPDPCDIDTVIDCRFGQSTSGIGGYYGDLMAECDHPLADFVDVRLCPAEIGIIASSHHRDPKGIHTRSLRYSLLIKSAAASSGGLLRSPAIRWLTRYCRGIRIAVILGGRNLNQITRDQRAHPGRAKGDRTLWCLPHDLIGDNRGRGSRVLDL